MTGRTSSRTGAAQEGAGRRRADAERNIATIVAAATDLFAHAPDANMTEIARAAGVGRVTLYSHFPSREVLIRAVLEQAIGQSTQIIEDARGARLPPVDAFAHLIRTTWPLIGRFGRLHNAAQRALPADEVRHLHDPPMAHVRELIVQGQEAGEFRTDLPLEWLVSTVYALLHAAMEAVASQHLDQNDAGEALVKTLLGALRSEPEDTHPAQS
ncbi:TetR/AcrR family transcriptional regulator [Spirillospora sp. CA-142024]|uniref:TetR/AcrR family transcriptional regulator n=1 Tax=Spirillospora sp. CA-142024 TaxID=3240036 RepID=UPI003D8B6324